MNPLSHASAQLRASLPLAALVVAAFALLFPFTATAHENRAVGDYTFVVGFIAEPAIQDDTNGIWLSVTKGDTPVTGLADTLQAQVLFGDQSKDMPLVPAFGEDGTYESVFIPTAPGDYTFRFTGTIDGVEVDETFTSSPEGFDSVAARSELEFPVSDDNGASDTGTTRLGMPLAIGGLTVLVAGGAWIARRRAA